MGVIRWVLSLWIGVLVVCMGCGGDDDTTVTDDVNPDPIDVTSCASATGIDQIVCIADAFKAQLNASQLSELQRDYSLADAKKWSAFPEGVYSGRVGLSFAAMTSTQIGYAKALLKAAAGTVANEGWDELQQLLDADEYLEEHGGGADYGDGHFYIALLGTPAASGTFEIQFGGNHIAFANTYRDGVLVGATPSFRGVEPMTAFVWNGKTRQPLTQERTALSAMLTGLTTDQQSSAYQGTVYTDLVAGPQQDANFPAEPLGVRAGDLTDAQKALILTAIKTYTNDVSDNAAFLAKCTTELDDTYITYSGTTGLATLNDYVRIDGPSVWIEYLCLTGEVLPVVHPHTVWRDKTSDYGGNE